MMILNGWWCPSVIQSIFSTVCIDSHLLVFMEIMRMNFIYLSFISWPFFTLHCPTLLTIMNNKNDSFSDREKSMGVTAGSNISNFQILLTLITNFEFSNIFTAFLLIFDQPRTWCGWGTRQRNVSTISSEIFDISLQKAGRWGFILHKFEE